MGESEGTARARTFAERLAAALGDGWIVETRQAAAPGTVPHAAVRRVDGPLRLLLEDLGVFVAVTLFPWDKGRHWQPRRPADLAAKAPAIAAAVAEVSAAGEDGRTNVADAAWRIAAAVETMIPLQGGVWDFSITSVAYPPVYGSVNLIGSLMDGGGWQGIVTCAPRPDGVLIEVPGTQVSLPAATPADVRAHLVPIAHGILARFDERRRHHQSALKIRAAAEEIVKALRERVEPPRGRWSIELSSPFPSPPAAHVMARGGSDYVEGFVTVDEQDGALRLQTRDVDARRAETIERIVTAEGDLPEVIDEAVAAVRWWTGRLSAPRLELSRRYRVLRPFADLLPGAEIVFKGRDYIPREAWTRYGFAAPGGREVLIDEGLDTDLAILRDLDLYVEPS